MPSTFLSVHEKLGLLEKGLKKLKHSELMGDKEFKNMYNAVETHYRNTRLAHLTGTPKDLIQKAYSDTDFFAVLVRMLTDVASSLEPRRNIDLDRVQQWYNSNRHILYSSPRFGKGIQQAEAEEIRQKSADGSRPTSGKRRKSGKKSAKKSKDIKKSVKFDETKAQYILSRKLSVESMDVPEIASTNTSGRTTPASQIRAPYGTPRMSDGESDEENKPFPRRGTNIYKSPPQQPLPQPKMVLPISSMINPHTQYLQLLEKEKAAKNKVDPVKIQNQKNERMKQWKAFQEQQNYGQDVLGKLQFCGRSGAPYGQRYAAHDYGEAPEVVTRDAVNYYLKTNSNDHVGVVDSMDYSSYEERLTGEPLEDFCRTAEVYSSSATDRRYPGFRGNSSLGTRTAATTPRPATTQFTQRPATTQAAVRLDAVLDLIDPVAEDMNSFKERLAPPPTPGFNKPAASMDEATVNIRPHTAPMMRSDSQRSVTPINIQPPENSDYLVHFPKEKQQNQQAILKKLALSEAIDWRGKVTPDVDRYEWADSGIAKHSYAKKSGKPRARSANASMSPRRVGSRPVSVREKWRTGDKKNDIRRVRFDDPVERSKLILAKLMPKKESDQNKEVIGAATHHTTEVDSRTTQDMLKVMHLCGHSDEPSPRYYLENGFPPSYERQMSELMAEINPPSGRPPTLEYLSLVTPKAALLESQKSTVDNQAREGSIAPPQTPSANRSYLSSLGLDEIRDDRGSSFIGSSRSNLSIHDPDLDFPEEDFNQELQQNAELDAEVNQAQQADTPVGNVLSNIDGTNLLTPDTRVQSGTSRAFSTPDTANIPGIIGGIEIKDGDDFDYQDLLEERKDRDFELNRQAPKFKVVNIDLNIEKPKDRDVNTPRYIVSTVKSNKRYGISKKTDAYHKIGNSNVVNSVGQLSVSDHWEFSPDIDIRRLDTNAYQNAPHMHVNGEHWSEGVKNPSNFCRECVPEGIDPRMKGKSAKFSEQAKRSQSAAGGRPKTVPGTANFVVGPPRTAPSIPSPHHQMGGRMGNPPVFNSEQERHSRTLDSPRNYMNKISQLRMIEQEEQEEILISSRPTSARQPTASRQPPPAGLNVKGLGYGNVGAEAVLFQQPELPPDYGSSGFTHSYGTAKMLHKREKTMKPSSRSLSSRPVSSKSNISYKSESRSYKELGRPIPDYGEVNDPDAYAEAVAKHREAAAAVDIQRIFRGFLVRNMCRELKMLDTHERQKLEDQRKAATEIQRRYRGHLTRKEKIYNRPLKTEESINWAQSYGQMLDSKERVRSAKADTLRQELSDINIQQANKRSIIGPHVEVYQSFHQKRTQPNKAEFYKAATIIQKYIRGFLIRLKFESLKRKSVYHASSFKQFMKDYRALLIRCQTRHGVGRPKTPFDIRQVNEYMDLKKRYESVFDRHSYSGRLDESELPQYFSECDLYPSPGEVDDAADAIFSGRLRERNKGLTKKDILDLTFHIYVPKAAGLTDTRKSTWLNPIIDGEEALKLKGSDIVEKAPLKPCMDMVIESMRANKEEQRRKEHMKYYGGAHN